MLHTVLNGWLPYLLVGAAIGPAMWQHRRAFARDGLTILYWLVRVIQAAWLALRWLLLGGTVLAGVSAVAVPASSEGYNHMLPVFSVLAAMEIVRAYRARRRAKVPRAGSPHLSQPEEALSDKEEHRRSYISRHWRGELSLGVSYWINFCLVGWIVGMCAVALAAADITLAPRLFAAADAGFIVSLVVIMVWQFVGIWRSAGRSIRRHKARGESRFWAITARVVTVIGVISLTTNTLAYSLPSVEAYLQIALGNDPAASHHVLRVLYGGSEIELTGGIDFGTSADLQTLLEATPQVRVIEMHSLGGRIAEAEHVRDLIQVRHLATYTNALCASACTVAYLGGSPRYLGHDGSLGFHRYSFPGFTPEQDADLNRQGEQYLIDAGIDRSFAARVFATASDDLWVPDHPTLLRAGVVTLEVGAEP